MQFPGQYTDRVGPWADPVSHADRHKGWSGVRDLATPHCGDEHRPPPTRNQRSPVPVYISEAGGTLHPTLLHGALQIRVGQKCLRLGDRREVVQYQDGLAAPARRWTDSAATPPAFCTSLIESYIARHVS